MMWFNLMKLVQMRHTKNTLFTGLDRIQNDPGLTDEISGRVGYLCHNASVDRNLNHGSDIMHDLFGSRLTAFFAPQHGLYTDAQDNMIESPHFVHPIYQIPVFSLYSETREPTLDMLSNIDTLVIDLQDSGVRVYTYIWTMILALKSCANAGKKVVILDRPNPLDGISVEGNILESGFKSFIGLHPIPMRHGMTMGEIAEFGCKFWDIDVDLHVISVDNWDRSQQNVFTCGEVTFDKLPWVLPSPNLSTPDTLRVYPGSVLFEGTNLSEGRGTVRPFELFGHPKLNAFAWREQLEIVLNDTGFGDAVRLRPHTFVPTFEKWAGTTCHGYQIHLSGKLKDRGIWTAVQLIMRELYYLMGSDFEWRQPPFEYVHDQLPIDILNGTDKIRKWIEDRGSLKELDTIASQNMPDYLEKRSIIIQKS